MKSKRFIVVGLLLLLLTVGIGAWWVFADPGPDPEVEEIKATMKTAFESRDSMTPQERAKTREDIHQRIGSLTEEQRREVFSGMRDRFRGMIEKRFDEYFDAPPEERTAVLDRHIVEMEKFRREMDQRREARRPGGGPPGGHRPRGSRTPEQRRERMKNRLDNSDPTHRAKAAEYFGAMRKRREELGLPPMRRHRH